MTKLRAFWERYYNHKAVCPECGQLKRIGFTHSRPGTKKLATFPGGYAVKCNGVAL